MLAFLNCVVREKSTSSIRWRVNKTGDLLTDEDNHARKSQNAAFFCGWRPLSITMDCETDAPASDSLTPELTQQRGRIDGAQVMRDDCR
jgi:hypothetical protein